MARLDADDQPVWMLATQAPPGTTIPYQFVIDGPLHGVPVESLMRMLTDDERGYLEAIAEQQRRKVADPANPRSIAPQSALMTGDDPRAVPPERGESVLDLSPGRPTAAATSRTESTRDFRLRSEALGSDRRVVVRSTASRQESSERWLLVALDGILVANRHLRTVLRARDYDVTLHQFPGGHDLVHWQHTVLDGVQHLTTSEHHLAETG